MGAEAERIGPIGAVQTMAPAIKAPTLLTCVGESWAMLAINGLSFWSPKAMEAAAKKERMLE